MNDVETENLLEGEIKSPVRKGPSLRVDYMLDDPQNKKAQQKTRKEVSNQKQLLGHVNAIGEYVSQYETLPGSMSEKESVGTKLKQLLTPKSKRLENEQEAWLTAHKIVNQVNRETLDVNSSALSVHPLKHVSTDSSFS